MVNFVELLDAVKLARDFIEWEPDDGINKDNCEGREILLDTLSDLLREAGVETRD